MAERKSTRQVYDVQLHRIVRILTDSVPMREDLDNLKRDILWGVALISAVTLASTVFLIFLMVPHG